MSVLFTRNLLLISMSVLACLGCSNEEVSNLDDSVEPIYAINLVHYNFVDREGSGWFAERTLIESSKDLTTEVSKLPRRLMRPESKQNIFRQGEWALIAESVDSLWGADKVMSTDGQLSFLISKLVISFLSENRKPTSTIEGACRLTVDDSHKIQSKYRTVIDEVPIHCSWENITDEFMKALEEGKTLEVTLIDKDEEEIYVKAYTLAGFAENVIAFRKLQKDSPRVERDEDSPRVEMED